MEENTNQNQEQQNLQSQGQNQEQQSHSEDSVDVDRIGKEAVDKLLKEYGIESTDGLKDIVNKVRAEEDKNLSESEKVLKENKALTKKLAESEKDRLLAESKLSAIKLGAKPELIDDLVVVAMSRADKDVLTAMQEIKDSSTGSVYFVKDEEESGGTCGTRGTRGSLNNNSKDNGKNNNARSEFKGFASRIAESMKDKGSERKTYFK